LSLVETLHELAKLHLRKREFIDAGEAIDECIEVYIAYYDVWKEDWIKDRFRAARSLRTRINRQT